MSDLNRLEREALGWHYIFVQMVPFRWPWLRKQAHLMHWRIMHRSLVRNAPANRERRRLT